MQRRKQAVPPTNRIGIGRRLPLAQRYGAATILVLCTFGFWWAISDVPSDARFIAFMPAVVASAFLFGRGAGHVATLLSATLVLYQFAVPVGSILPDETTIGALVIFLATSVFATALIETLRATVDQLASTNSLLETVIEGTPEPIGVKDEHGRYVRANALMAQLLGAEKQDVIGKRDVDLLPPETAAAIEAADGDILRSGLPQVSEEVIDLAGAAPRCYSYSRAPWFGPSGNVLGVISIVRDIEHIKQIERDLRASDEHKAILLHDINHRIKNSLASVAGLLELSRLRVDDPAAQSAMSDAVRQLVVLSQVFDRLHQTSTQDVIAVRGFLEDLCNDLVHSIVGDRVKLRTMIDEVAVGLDRAISLGLIINELVTNALKYAFPEERAGEIVVRLLSEDPSRLCLEVKDDGIGLSADKKEGTGRALIGALARQLGGAVEWRGSPGTTARITFPKTAEAA